MPIGQRIKASDDGFFEAVIRYLVYSTIGCYFVAPRNVLSDTQGATQVEGQPDRQSDNTQAKILKPSPEKLCFPAIPLAFPRFPTFRELTSTENVDWYSLSYRNWCVQQGAMKQTADVMASLGLNATNVDVPGQAGPLRVAEGVDSITNIINSANAESTAASSGYLLCSITQAGGLLYSFVVITIVSLLLVFIPAFNWLSQFLYDGFCLVSSSAGSSSTAQQTQQADENNKKEIPVASLGKPASVKRGSGIGSFLARRAQGAYAGARGAARGAARAGVGTVRGVYNARNLPRKLPGFGLTQKVAVKGGVGLNKAAFYGVRGAARGTARGAIGIGRGTYRTGRGSARLGYRAGAAGARSADQAARGAYQGTLQASRESVRLAKSGYAGARALPRQIQEAPETVRRARRQFRDELAASLNARRGVRYAGEARDINSARGAGANRFVKLRTGELRNSSNRELAATPEGSRLGAVRRARGAYRDSVDRRVAQRNAAAGNRWFQLTKRDRAPVAPVQNIPVQNIPVARPIPAQQQQEQNAKLDDLYSKAPERNDGAIDELFRTTPERTSYDDVDALFRSAPSSANPDFGEAGPIIDYYVSPQPTKAKLVPDAEKAWDLMTGVGAQAYAQRGIDKSMWLAAVHGAFDRRTVSEEHTGMLFAMGLNAYVPWIVELNHGRDAPFARCNREFALKLFGTITRDSAKATDGEPNLNKRAFVNWYNDDVLTGRSKVEGFHFVTTHDEDVDDDAPNSTSITIGNHADVPLSRVPRGFLTGLVTKAHDKLRSALTATTGFEQVSPEETDGEFELDPEDVDDAITMYESDLDSIEEEVYSDDEEPVASDAGHLMLPNAMAEQARPVRWGWDLGA